MKILVISDTHGAVNRLLDCIRKEKTADACFFLGDGWRDADTARQAFPEIPFYVVRGNCDFGSFEPKEGLAAFGGVLFFYTHGDIYGVKSGFEMICEAAIAKGADVALFGHTHQPLIRNTQGVWLFNPGSLYSPRTGFPSYGRITIQNSTPLFEICTI